MYRLNKTHRKPIYLVASRHTCDADT